MKHAAIKIGKARKIEPQKQFEPAEKVKKISTPKSAQEEKSTKSKIENNSGISVSENKKTKKKLVSSVIIAFPKSETETSAPVFVKKIEREKTASATKTEKKQTKKTQLTDFEKLKGVSVKSKVSGENLKPRGISVPTKQEKKASLSIEKQKSQTKISSSNNSAAKPNLKREKVFPTATQNDKRTEKISKVLPVGKNGLGIPKKNVFFSINKIKVIERKISSPSENTDGKKEEINAKLFIPTPQLISPEAESAAKIALRKTKPKKIKPIGPAVFRGRKERYDFQVYPLDTEFIDFPAIYIISKRKTDKQKRAHHSLICIGQTESVSGEIKKHKNKCIKKHNANVISILPEENEKKRLKIEEDLRAAHAIICHID